MAPPRLESWEALLLLRSSGETQRSIVEAVLLRPIGILEHPAEKRLNPVEGARVRPAVRVRPAEMFLYRMEKRVSRVEWTGQGWVGWAGEGQGCLEHHCLPQLLSLDP